jgi:hypothetical protein
MRLISVLGLVFLINYSFASTVRTVVLDAKEISMGTISSTENPDILANTTVSFLRNEFSPIVTKVNYQVRVKRYTCTDYVYSNEFHRPVCSEWVPYYILKNRKFEIEFTYTTPLLRGQVETYQVNFAQKKITRRTVLTTLKSSETVRVYDFIKKRNKLEAYIYAVRRLDFWW